MKRYLKHFIIGIVLLALFVPAGALLAQDELTLESLAETVATLTETVTGLSGRVEAIEAIWSGPGSIELDGSLCEIGARRALQDATVLKYKDKWDEWPSMDEIFVIGVRYSSESGHMFIVYESGFFDDRFVIEEWNGCEFVGPGDWWEE